MFKKPTPVKVSRPPPVVAQPTKLKENSLAIIQILDFLPKKNVEKPRT
jgi:hypothetical protein